MVCLILNTHFSIPANVTHWRIRRLTLLLTDRCWQPSRDSFLIFILVLIVFLVHYQPYLERGHLDSGQALQQRDVGARGVGQLAARSDDRTDTRIDYRGHIIYDREPYPVVALEDRRVERGASMQKRRRRYSRPVYLWA